MKSFLKLVADAYFLNEKDSLLDYCFIFPNKRSGTFFSHYLETTMSGEPFIMPSITSMSDFVGSFSNEIVATRYEQLFTLYNCYSRLSKDINDFDRFLFWGEMLLNDFNDVDSYLVDASRLFTNVKRLKEINANYLTPEQLEIIEHYWGEIPPGYNPEEFWRHIKDEDKAGMSEEQFLKLWEVLNPLYEEFNKSLAADGLITRGMLYRNCVNRLRKISADELPFKRYIFVGFNVLSTSEIAIFEKLKALGVADFYWDYNSPAFRSKGNHATRFLSRNIEKFPPRYDFDSEPITTFPEIDIVGVASKVGQAKYAGLKVQEWLEEGKIANPDNPIDTAIVLPDEFLFIPLIHSIPTPVEKVNITMGYPMRHTSISALMKSIVSMHLRARVVRGNMCYFYEDLLNVLASPMIRAIAPKESADAINHLNNNRLFTITVDDLIKIAPTLRPVFAEVTDTKDFRQVYDYMAELLAFLERKLSADHRSVEPMFIEAYRMALLALREAAEKYTITMRDSTFFRLLERAVSSDTVSFVGQPLKGLQIMGVLETRALDFDNLIMLSMNERIFPRKHYTRSFIPETLRRVYGLSTTEFQESMYAYTFYRLISRSKRVTLIYDARTVGGRSSEMSRYLTQLLYLYNKGNIVHRIANYHQIPINKPLFEVSKDSPEVRAKLDLFKTPGSRKRLSASSINDYINCGINFYLKNIEGFYEENEVVDYMDSSTYGTVLHEVAERLYVTLAGKGCTEVPQGGIVVNESDLDRLINSKTLIDTLITTSINHHYLKYREGDLTPLVGENLLIGRAIKMFITEMLERERQYTPFRFIAAEHEIKTTMRVNADLQVNIRQFIDRIDRVNIDRPDGGLLRLVDYKTGSDKLEAVSMDDMFTPSISENRFRPKAFLQLMFYCYAYAGFKKPDETIQPFIYGMRDIKMKGLRPLTIGDKVVKDYRPYHDEFVLRFNKVIEEIFDVNVPFRQASDPHACNYCQFKEVCIVQEKEK